QAGHQRRTAGRDRQPRPELRGLRDRGPVRGHMDRRAAGVALRADRGEVVGPAGGEPGRVPVGPVTATGARRARPAPGTSIEACALPAGTAHARCGAGDRLTAVPDGCAFGVALAAVSRPWRGGCALGVAVGDLRAAVPGGCTFGWRWRPSHGRA